MGVRFWNNCFHLSDGNHRHVSNEETEQCKEETEASKIGQNVNQCRTVIAPASWQKVVRQGGYCNHKTLEPHSDVHEDGYDEDNGHIGSHLLEPKDLGRYHVA